MLNVSIYTAIIYFISTIFFILTYNDVRSENINKISGFAKVVDGDTIKINSKKIRLYGIDAPEKKQKCKKMCRIPLKGL